MRRCVELRSVYAEKALSQIPRLLSLQDRNPYSPTYGCFHRDYWLYKTSDFPDAVRQFGVQALALAYAHDFPGNPYRGNPKVRDWAVAGMRYWASIQHAEGSFDEFYPYERGWVGPSAFTTFAVAEALRLLKEEIPPEVAEEVLAAVRRAARFIAGGESEEDHLANHHAMACLAVWKAHEALGDPSLKAGFERLWQGFRRYHDFEEGWSREYDGVDPGYLSATVSFLAKVYPAHPDPKMLEVLRQSVEFCSYFVYPDGSYAGSLGSRNTLHFYPHGFEVLAGELPLAAAVAERLLRGLAEGKLVPPEIMSDRYVFYRVPEFLQAYLDYAPRPSELPPLPYQRAPFRRYFPKARAFACRSGRHYVIANLAKGGVVKVFDAEAERLLQSDSGLIGQLADGRVVTSQWVDEDSQARVDDGGWEVAGRFHAVPSHKSFTPRTGLVFRLVLVALGWSRAASHWLKGRIRRSLMLGRRPVPVRFRRRLRFENGDVLLRDELAAERGVEFRTLGGGGEFFVRYVPQSRFFQPCELAAGGFSLNPEEVARLNADRKVSITRSLSDEGHKTPVVSWAKGFGLLKTVASDGFGCDE